MKAPRKLRLDLLLVQLGLATTRVRAASMIMAGDVLVEGRGPAKAGDMVALDAKVKLTRSGPSFVSRGGIKLAGALDTFGIDPKGWRCLDVGASTGGFTDCLLQRGALHVFAIDVGRGHLDPKIRNNEAVTWRESFHVRELTPDFVGSSVDLAVVDVSFISLRHALPPVIPCVRPLGKVLALVKPQFEAEPRDVPKGVLRDGVKRKQVLESVRLLAEELGLVETRLADSVLPGQKGNLEAFLLGTVPGHFTPDCRKSA